MAKKLTEADFDCVMENLADELGLVYHSENGIFHPSDNPDNFIVKLLGAVGGSVAELGKMVNKDLIERNQGLQKQVSRLQSDIQLICNHIGIELQTNPEKRVVVSTKAAPARPSRAKKPVTATELAEQSK